MRRLRVGDSVLLDGVIFGVRVANLIRIFDKGVPPPLDWQGAALLHALGIFGVAVWFCVRARGLSGALSAVRPRSTASLKWLEKMDAVKRGLTWALPQMF